MVTVALSSCNNGYPNPPPFFTGSPLPTLAPSAARSCTTSAARTTASSDATGPTLSLPASKRRARGAASGVAANQLYVTYRRGATLARTLLSSERSVMALRAVDIGRVNGQSLRALTFADGTDLKAAAAALRSDPTVSDVAPVHLRGLASDPAAGANDQYFDNVDQWYLYKSNVVANAANTGAWNLGTGCSAISVAVIDTGVDLNGGDTNDFIVDFAERVLNGAVTVGTAAVQDTNGHGTNTAGLAAAQANNGYGFAGAGYSIHLQVYKIFPDANAQGDSQSASTADEAQAINDAVTHGASVISLSLGSPQSSGADPGEQAAIANAIASGVVVVAANGNEFPTADGQLPDYPAAYPGVIAVGASAVQNATPNSYASITAETVASYSNSGPTLIAPGGDATGNGDNDLLHWIEGYSTTTAGYPPDQCSNGGTPKTCRVLFNGTSQATPQVAGIIALMEAYHGGARSLSPSQVASILTATADSIGAPPSRQGAGRVNAGKAVAAAHP